MADCLYYILKCKDHVLSLIMTLSWETNIGNMLALYTVLSNYI